MAFILPEKGISNPSGIMFHHFHGLTYNKSPGSISSNDLEKLLDNIEADKLLSADKWVDKFFNKELNEDFLCLTFDDNLKCQYEIALPVLRKRKIKAFWFIHTAILEGHTDYMELYRYFRSETFKSHDDFFNSFLDVLNKFDLLKKCENALSYFIAENFLISSTYLSKNEKKFKFLRDEVLLKEEYTLVMNYMINKFSNKNILEKNLYMSIDNICELIAEGHIIGLHSHTHPTALKNLNKNEQKKEFQKNYEVLFNHAKINPISMSHPCNSYNEDTLDVLKELDIKIGFRADTVKNEYSNLEFPRYNHTNLMQKLQNV